MKQMASICVVVIAFAAVYSDNELPRVRITYSPILDSVCGFFKGYEIKDAWKNELEKKKKKLETDWSEFGDKLLSTTEEIVGKKFKRKSVTAHLTLCNTPSRSFPIVVNMRYALRSFIAPPVPVYAKTGTLYHEILHKYVDDNLPQSSKLLQQCENEHPTVLEHLHLLALQKAVYLRLQLKDQLSTIIKVDGQLPNGHYKRAWKIVNSKPGYYQEFISELKA